MASPPPPGAMRSPPPHIPDFQRYADNTPSSGNRPPSREDIDDYFDHNPPAPYRLSGSYISPGHSPSGSVDNFHSRPMSTGGSGPRYLSPLAAAGATDTEGVGMRHPNYSEMSMIGLNTATPGLQRKSTWLEKETRNRKKNHRLFIVSCSILTLIIVVAIALGIFFGTRGNKNGGGSTNDAAVNNTINTSTAGAVQQGSDPSQFVRNDTFHNSFYGVAYTMMDALYPNCNEGLPSVIEDIQILSQLTTRMRLYGSDCNQTQLVLEAIKQVKANMTVYVAIYIVVDDDSAYQRQKTALKDAITTYGVNNIEGVTVGNEYMLDYITEYGNGNTDVNSAVGTTASTFLKTKITDVRQMMSDLGYPNVPVGSADAGAFFNNDLMSAIDFGLSNIHAWFAPTTAAQAANWTNTFYEDNNVAAAALLPNHPKMVIAETGWPTHSNGTATETSGAGPGSEASVANLQVFLDTFICDANTAGTPYFMFEYSDVPWKDEMYGGVEGFWGMFDSNKRLKAITLPNCAHQ